MNFPLEMIFQKCLSQPKAHVHNLLAGSSLVVGEIRRYSKNNVAEKCPLENLELNFGSGLFCPQFPQFGSYIRCSRMKFSGILRKAQWKKIIFVCIRFSKCGYITLGSETIFLGTIIARTFTFYQKTRGAKVPGLTRTGMYTVYI